MTPDALLRLAKEIGARHGAVVTSHRRTPSKNAEVGGSPNSLHLQGLAVDLAPPSEALADELRAAGLHLITQVHGTAPHIHAQTRPLPGGAGSTTGPTDLPAGAGTASSLAPGAADSDAEYVDLALCQDGDCDALQSAAVVLGRLGWHALEAMLLELAERIAARLIR